MKLFIEKENTLKIDDSTELVLLNVNDFISNIKRESSFVPTGHIKVSLKYKLINNDNEYFGESIFDSYKDISNEIDDYSPYKVELINWKLSDKEEKYLEFNIEKNYSISSYGTFIDTLNADELIKYIINDDYKTKVKKAKLEAFNWIKNCKTFDIKKVEYEYSSAVYHDEKGTSNIVEKTIDDEYDDLASIFFYCQKDNEDFELKPTFKIISTNNNEYVIPEIEIYHYEPEKIGLININIKKND